MPGANARFFIEIGLRAAASAGRRRLAARARHIAPTDVFLCIVDHFEPSVGGADRATALARLEDWERRYPAITRRHHDALGRHPAHSFFYPWDEYEEEEFCRLQALCAAGHGEIELHLHHQDDTEETLKRTLCDALTAYRKHGALSVWPDGKPAFAFIHGNWALDNSRHEGGRNFCGVDSEISLLARLGCYADFTFPAWPQTAQPRQTNSLFYATDDPVRPKSHDRGVSVRRGRQAEGDLLLIQGPLVPYLTRDRGRWRVAVDDADLASYRRYSPHRLDRWVRCAPRISGRPDRAFIKLHTHGAADANRMALLGEDLHALFSDAEARYNDGQHYRLHYVTARQMFNVIKATEADAATNLETARDWLLPGKP